MSTGPNIDTGASGGSSSDTDDDTSSSDDSTSTSDPTGPSPTPTPPGGSNSGSGSTGSGDSSTGSSGGDSNSGGTSGSGSDADSGGSSDSSTDTGSGTNGGSTEPTGPGPDLERPDGETVSQDEADRVRRTEDIRETISEETGGRFGGTGGNGASGIGGGRLGTGGSPTSEDGSSTTGDGWDGEDASEPVGGGGLGYVGWDWRPTEQQREAADRADGAVRTGDASAPMDQPAGAPADVTAGQREQILDRYMQEVENSMYGRSDLLLREDASGDLMVVPSREAVRRETAEQLLDQVGDDYSREDVVFSFDEEARLRANLSQDAVRREVAEDYLEQVGDGRFDTDDVVFRRDDEGNLTPELNQEAREEATLDRELGTTGTPGFIGTPSADDARREAEGVAASDRGLYQEAAERQAEGALASDRNLFEAELEERIREQGGDPDDYTVRFEQTDEGLQASVELTGDPSAGPVANFVRDVADDPAGDFREGVFRRRDEAAEWGGERIDDVEDELGVSLEIPESVEERADDTLERAQRAGETAFVGATILPRTASVIADRADVETPDREEVAGAAAVGVAVPELGTTVGGGVVLLGLGALAGGSYIASELDVGQEDEQSEIEIPEEDQTAEITVPAEPTSDAEIDPEGTATTDVIELPVQDPTADQTEPGTIQTGAIVDEPAGETGLPQPDQPSLPGYESPTVTEDDVDEAPERIFPTGEEAVVGSGTGESVQEDVTEPEVTIEDTPEADVGAETGTVPEVTAPTQSVIPGAGATVGPLSEASGQAWSEPFTQVTPASTSWATSMSTPGTQQFDTPQAEAYPNEFAEPFEFGPGMGFPVGYGYGSEPIRPRLDDGGSGSSDVGVDGLGGFDLGADDDLGPGWFAETVDTIATRGTEPVEAPSEDVLEEMASGSAGGELPTQAFVSDDPAEREAVEEAYGLFSGGGFDFGDGRDDDGGWFW